MSNRLRKDVARTPVFFLLGNELLKLRVVCPFSVGHKA